MSHAISSILKDHPSINFNMYALNDSKLADHRYISQADFKGFEGNKMSFAFQAILKGIKSNAIVLSHINLLCLALAIKIFNKNVKIIMMAHGIEVWRPLAAWKKYFINKHVVIWAVSNFTSEYLKNEHKISLDRIRTLNNCLDPFFKAPLSFGKPLKLLNKHLLTVHQPILLSVARLTRFEKNKGYDQVLNVLPDLLPEFPNICYLLCGKSDNTEKLRIEKLIIKHGLQKNVKLLNFIHEEELEDHYQLADIFVLPSKKEGFGLVFIEAAACGRKIISGNSDGSSDALLNGKLGNMIDVDDPRQLKEALTINLRKALNHQEAKKIQTICLANFSHDQYIKNVKKLLFHYE